MYAVIETGGKQYRVAEGDVIKVEKLALEEGDKAVFDNVLLVAGDDGVKVGQPYLEGVTVEGSVMEQGKAKKVVVFKYKSKKNYRKRQGHRQPFTRIKIEKIG